MKHERKMYVKAGYHHNGKWWYGWRWFIHSALSTAVFKTKEAALSQGVSSASRFLEKIDVEVEIINKQ